MDINNVLESVLKNPEFLDVISKKTWLEKKQAKWEIAKALPLILEWLEENVKDPNKLESLKTALEKKHSQWFWDKFWNIDLEDGWKIISHIFWDKKNDIEKKVGNTDVLKALWPVVMWALGKSAKEKWGSLEAIIWVLSWSSKKSSWILVAIFDKDGDWDYKDDLFKMILNWIKRKFLGK